MHESSIPKSQTVEPLDSGIAAGLDAFERNIEQAALDIAQNPGTYSSYHFPENFSTSPKQEVMADLKAGHHEATELSRFIALSERAREVYNSFSSTPQTRLDLLSRVSIQFGAAKLQETYHAEQQDGALHQLIADSMAAATKEDVTPQESYMVPQIQLLQNLYQLERPIDLLQPTDDAYLSKVRDQLLSQNGVKWLFSLEVRSQEIEQPLSLHREKEKYRQWMRDVVLRATDLTDPELADDYVFAASRGDEQSAMQVGDIVQKIDTLGTEKLALLREFSDTCALADYSLAQLDRMVRLAKQDPEEVKRLNRHDVITVFTNKMGDRNNILSNVPEIVDDSHERAVFFEIRNIADVYRGVLKLEELGIKSSTLIVAAHGDGGQLPISTKPEGSAERGHFDIATIHRRAFVAQVNLEEGKAENYNAFAMDNMKGLARLIDEKMRPSRAIDDPTEAIGKKRIVFISCNMDKTGVVKDRDTETGDIVEGEEASVASRLADDLASNSNSDIEIFSAVTGIQTQPSARGISYTIVKEAGSLERIPLGASKYTVKEGRTERQLVDEITLRNFDKRLT